MNTNLKTRIINNAPVVGRSIVHVSSNNGHGFKDLKAVNDEHTHEERSLVKTAGMFFAAPIIALAFVIAMPFIGIFLIAKLAFEVSVKRFPALNGGLKSIATLARNIGLFFASPFIALTYVIALPFVGIYMFSKLAMEARGHNA